MTTTLFKLLCPILLLSSTALAVEIKLCYEEAIVYPWITGHESGLVFTELKLVEKSLGMKFTYIRLPWKRCQYEAQSGNIDGLIAASFTKERSEWGVYPTLLNGELDTERRLHTDSFYVYARKDSAVKFKNKKFLQLGTNQIGVQLGYSVGNDLIDMGLPVHSSFTTAYDILKQLNINVLSVAVLQNHETVRTMRENPHFARNIRRFNQPFKVKDQYLMVTKPFYAKNKKLMNSIWTEISEARKSEAYRKAEEELLSKYN